MEVESFLHYLSMIGVKSEPVEVQFASLYKFVSLWDKYKSNKLPNTLKSDAFIIIQPI